MHGELAILCCSIVFQVAKEEEQVGMTREGPRQGHIWTPYTHSPSSLLAKETERLDQNSIHRPSLLKHNNILPVADLLQARSSR